MEVDSSRIGMMWNRVLLSKIAELLQ